MLAFEPMPGYSGTPLIKKLGIKPPMRLSVIGAPKEYLSWLGELPHGVVVTNKLAKLQQAAHVFVTQRTLLAQQLKLLRKQLEQTGFVWVSWPKKASKVETDVSEDVIRDVALPLGFVDIKVCAVSEVWSGLKLVIRKSERSNQ